MQIRRRKHERTVLVPGQVVEGRDRYEVGDIIGEGGWAVVYDAMSSRQQRVALKEFLPGGTVLEREHTKRFFLRERDVLWRLRSHPHLPDLIEAFSQDGMRYLAMEYVSGESLRERLDRQAPLPPDEVASLSLQLARAAASLHADGVVHHDIKPENVKTRPTGIAVLLDFGSARTASETLGSVRDKQEATGDAQSAGLNLAVEQLGMEPIVGTPGYMAPEIREMVETETFCSRPSLDVFSLGCTIYELATGNRLNQDDVDAKNEAAIDKAIQEIRAVAPYLAPAIAQALKLDPTERLRTAGELLAGLSEVIPPRPATRRVALELDISAGVGEAEQTLTITNAGGGTLEGLVRATAPWLGLRRPDGTRTTTLGFSGNLVLVRVVADMAMAAGCQPAPEGIVVETAQGSVAVACTLTGSEAGPMRLVARPTQVTLSITAQIVQQISVNVRNEGRSAGGIAVSVSPPGMLDVSPQQVYLPPKAGADFRIRPLLMARSGTRFAQVSFVADSGESRAVVGVTVRASAGLLQDISDRLFRHRN